MNDRMQRPSHLIHLILTVLMVTSCTSASMEQQIKQSESLRNLGEAYMIEGKATMALKELLRANAIYGDDPYLQNDLGLTYMAKDKLDLAVTHFKKAVALKPDWPNARNNLATAYLRQEKWDTAITYLKELSEDLLFTTPHYAHLNLGWAYFNKGDYPQATQYYRKALSHYEDGFKKDGTYLKALVGLARTHLATGKTREAVATLERAAQFGPDVAGVHFYLGNAYAQAGDRTEARRAFLRVMALEPDTQLAEEARMASQRLK